MDLREYLFHTHQSVTELAKILDTSRVYLYHIMSGRKVPSQKFLDKIAEKTYGKITTFEQLLDRRKLNGKKNSGEKE